MEHPKTRFIAFTGSKAVGLDIHERAAKARPGQIWIKRTILEMGGKDSILVCADADLDAAVEGVVASAFGFSGQKCSACSRAIVEAPIYDVFVERLRERVEKLTVGDPAENHNHGPGHQQGLLDSILGYIETGKKEGRLVAGGKLQTADGGYLRADGHRRCRAQRCVAQEEIFGPVLAVIKVNTFEEGLAVANNTEYGLTGAIYTAIAESWKLRGGSSTWAISTSIASAPAPWWGAPVRRLQHERHRLKGRRSGLLAACSRRPRASRRS